MNEMNSFFMTHSSDPHNKTILLSVSIILISDVNECLQNVCANGATCLDTPGSYRCICQPDYTGPNCETGKYMYQFEYL